MMSLPSSSSIPQQQQQQQQDEDSNIDDSNQHHQHYDDNNIVIDTPFPSSPLPTLASLGNHTNHHNNNTLFFADATLDLHVAHDIADTPEAIHRHHHKHYHPHHHKHHGNRSILRDIPALPLASSSSLSFDNDNNNDDPNIHPLTPPPPPPPPPLQGSILDIGGMGNSHSHPDTNITSTGSLSNKELQLSHQQNSMQSLQYNSHNNNNNNNNNNNDYQSQQQQQSHQSQRRIVSNMIMINQTNKLPKYPRDIPWFIAFFIFVPISFLYPLIHHHTNTNNTSNKNNVLAHHPLSFATLHAITWTILCCFIILRILYSKHRNNTLLSRFRYCTSTTVPITNIITTIAPFTILIYTFITILIFYICTTSTTTNHSIFKYWIVFIPLVYVIYEFYIYYYYISRRTNQNEIGMTSRIKFLHEMIYMSLDILLYKSNKLIKRFIRIISILILIQMCIIILWRIIILKILASSNLSFILILHFFYIFMIGLWCIQIILQYISYIVSASIMYWFHEQYDRIQQSQQQSQPNVVTVVDENQTNNHNNDNDNRSIVSRESSNSIPEAYRTVDESVYQSSVFHLDDILLNDDDDDDYDDDVIDNDEYDYLNNNQVEMKRIDRQQPYTSLKSNGNRISSSSSQYNHRNSKNNNYTISNGTTTSPTITMKSILIMGITTHFGSIVYCAFIAPIAQCIWNIIRYIEYNSNNNDSTKFHIQQQLPFDQNDVNNNGNNSQFQEMSIGSSHSQSSNGNRNMKYSIFDHPYTNTLFTIGHDFLRSHNDYAITHLAIYSKSYTRAAKDVSIIIDQSGLIPILHEDISSHICSSVCSVISGIIVLITTYLLLHQRKNHTTAEITELHVVETMLMSYVFSYSLLITTLEPIRAAIKASYIAFAQNPQCFLQSYPLIYHRLCRLSGTPTSTTTTSSIV